MTKVLFSFLLFITVLSPLAYSQQQSIQLSSSLYTVLQCIQKMGNLTASPLTDICGSQPAHSCENSYYAMHLCLLINGCYGPEKLQESIATECWECYDCLEVDDENFVAFQKKIQGCWQGYLSMGVMMVLSVVLMFV